METLKAVIFDLDDTLLDWRGHNADRLEVRHMHVRPLYEHLSDAGHLTTTLEEFGFFRNRRGGLQILGCTPHAHPKIWH